jgi:GNAT superfamily N-acetyltransferase
MRGLKLRKAELSDVDAIFTMRVSLQRHLEKSNPLVWRKTEEEKNLIQKNLDEQLIDENHLLLIAEVEDEVVGFAHGEVQHRSTHIPAIIGNIGSIFIIENFQRRGIGTRLIQEICQFFRTKSVEDVYLRYVLGNREGERFWEKLGFQPILVTTHSAIDAIETRIKSF